MTSYTIPSRNKTAIKNNSDLNSTQNLVDPEWEIIDPTPNIHDLFIIFNQKFFSGRLFCVELEWSTKMYSCAGICYSRRNALGSSCTIRLSEPLLKLRSRKDLVETLLHEMIHAMLFISGIREGNGGHGPNFKKKMTEINNSAGTNISVYHTFRDEVEVYKKHWWRCNGICHKRAPFYGFVKRTSNRKPSSNDFWWSNHQQNCGGEFIKVKEPESKRKPIKDVAKTSSSKKIKDKISPKKIKNMPPNQTRDIRTFFPKSTPLPSQSNVDPVSKHTKIEPTRKIETGNIVQFKDLREGATTNLTKITNTPFTGSSQTLGGSTIKKSRLLDEFDSVLPIKKIKIEEKNNKASKSEEIDIQEIDVLFDQSIISQNIRNEFEDDPDIILIDDEFDDSLVEDIKIESTESRSDTKCQCPVCNKTIEIRDINTHLDSCLN